MRVDFTTTSPGNNAEHNVEKYESSWKALGIGDFKTVKHPGAPCEACTYTKGRDDIEPYFSVSRIRDWQAAASYVLRSRVGTLTRCVLARSMESYFRKPWYRYTLSTAKEPVKL